MAIDNTPSSIAEPNVAPSWGGLAPSDYAGVNHAPPGTHYPVGQAMASYMPLSVLSREGHTTWVIPIALTAGALSQVIQFEYGQLGIEPGVRSVGFRGPVALNDIISFSDVVTPQGVLINPQGAAFLGYGIANVITTRDLCNLIIYSISGFLQGCSVILYHEEQLPVGWR